MSVSLAGFILCDVKLREPSENAAAKAPEVEDVGVELWLDPIWEGEASPPLATVDPFLFRWRRSCKAFARAFSCVLMNCARFYKPS